MELAERKVGGVTVIDVSGRIVSTDNPGRLKERVTGLVQQGNKHILLNLANVNYVDSSGLGELVACHGTAVRGGATVKLANTTRRIKDLLVMTKLLTVFDSYDSEEEGVKSFASL